MAKNNPQWEAFFDEEVLVVFHGPHAYVSPRWYAEKERVPTWNYAAVHAFGKVRAFHEPEAKRAAVAKLVAHHDPQWLPDYAKLSDGYMGGMLEAIVAFKAAGLDHSKHFVAVTGAGSKLDITAVSENWLARFPMWDWVGGRTSALCAVGLLPAALQGLDISALLDGAAAMDAVTRRPTTAENPAALLALMWHFATDGRGTKDMVVLPYKDRLLLFSRYLQQLVMESLGKEHDLKGNVVNQGIAVYGNKGSTDQHAYVQQLRDGVNNFFVTFIEVLKDRDAKTSLEVEPGVTAGDFLQGFYLGTRAALSEKDRHSVTITLPDVSPRTLGMVIALYERVVGLYASLIGINAYHQPGVEAGKKAAGAVIALKLKLAATLAATPGQAFTAEALATAAGSPDQAELAFKILEHLAANKSSGVKKRAKTPWYHSTYRT